MDVDIVLIFYDLQLRNIIIPEVNKKIIAIGISITIPNIRYRTINTIIDNDELMIRHIYINSKL